MKDEKDHKIDALFQMLRASQNDVIGAYAAIQMLNVKLAEANAANQVLQERIGDLERGAQIGDAAPVIRAA